MKLSLLLFLPFSVYSYVLVPLSLFSTPNAPNYPVGRSSRIFIVSNSPQDVLGNLGVYVGTQVKTGATLALPGPTGSLTPLIPSEDNSTLLIVQNDSKNCTGYLYITEDASSNVFPLSNNYQKYNFQPGTNLYFSLDYKNNSIDYPCAQHVYIGDNVSFRGYVGLPEENGPLFFDSESIPGLTYYNQLLLPMEIFHFKSSGNDVRYELSYDSEDLLSTNYSGLMSTKSFPTGYYTLYSLSGAGNFNNDNLTLFMMFRFDSTQNYQVNVTLTDLDNPYFIPILFPMNSSKDFIIQSTSPFHQIRIASHGPYTAQFRIQNLDPKSTTGASSTSTVIPVTTSTLVTTTKSSKGFANSLALFVVFVLRFL